MYFSDSTSHIITIQLETANVEEIINTQINIQSLVVNEIVMSAENWVDGNITITTLGCTDPVACNYDSNANENDETCDYPSENYDCDYNCTVELDCAGECGGDAE